MGIPVSRSAGSNYNVAADSDNYTIGGSLRLNGVDAYLSRVFGTPTNRNKWTWSGWVRRSSLSTLVSGMNWALFSAAGTGNCGNSIFFNTSADTNPDCIAWYNNNTLILRTSTLFRDVNSWMHIVASFDPGHVVPTERARIFINGNRALTQYYAAPSSNVGAINHTVEHRMGVDTNTSSYRFDGYLTEVNFIDGQALAPSDFGYFNEHNQWKPKRYTGTYGNNGFYLPMDARHTNGLLVSDLGRDYSGNNNTWNLNNINIGDWMAESPTNARHVVKWAPFTSSYRCEGSLRFDGIDDYLVRTSTTPTSQHTWTLSFWVRKISSSRMQVFSAGTGTTDATRLEFEFESSTEQFRIMGPTTTFAKTAMAFNDRSRAYHLLVTLDGSGTAFKIYVDGVLQTLSTSNNITTSAWNASSTRHTIGCFAYDLANYFFNGNLSDIHFIDGQSLTPDYFGQVDPITKQWIPKEYTKGNYGANGFYLSGNRGGSDQSGNSNNWTVNGPISTYDAPTNGVIGGVPRSNYCVIERGSGTITGGGTRVSGSNGVIGYGSFSLPMSGKWYWEMTPTTIDSGNGAPFLGLIHPSQSHILYGCAIRQNGQKFDFTTTSSAFTTALAANDVVGFAVDRDAGTVVCYVNGTNVGTLTTKIKNKLLVPAVFASGGTSTVVVNFGATPFSQTPPPGFKPLCISNLPTIDEKKTIGQFATLNPLDAHLNVTNVVSRGGLRASKSGAPANAFAFSHATLPITPQTPKIYFEANIYLCNSASATPYLGVSELTQLPSSVGNSLIGGGYYNPSLSVTMGVVGCAFDPATGKVWFRDITGSWLSGNPVLQTSPSHTVSAINNVIVVSYNDNTSYGFFEANFGQTPFMHPIPEGFVTLCATNL